MGVASCVTRHVDVFKVWEEITIPRYVKQSRYGSRAGQPNLRFLDAKLFNELVLTPYRDAKFETIPAPFSSSFSNTACSQKRFVHGSFLPRATH